MSTKALKMLGLSGSGDHPEKRTGGRTSAERVYRNNAAEKIPRDGSEGSISNDLAASDSQLVTAPKPQANTSNRGDQLMNRIELKTDAGGGVLKPQTQFSRPPKPGQAHLHINRSEPALDESSRQGTDVQTGSKSDNALQKVASAGAMKRTPSEGVEVDKSQGSVGNVATGRSVIAPVKSPERNAVNNIMKELKPDMIATYQEK